MYICWIHKSHLSISTVTGGLIVMATALHKSHLNISTATGVWRSNSHNIRGFKGLFSR
jgi:hypothetical protein